MRRRREGGQGLVEFAVILPVMLLMFMGVWSGAEVIEVNQSAAQVTSQAAQLGASLGDNGYVSGASSRSGCQKEANDPCIVDNAIIAAIIPALENELPDATLDRVDIYQPNNATATCLPSDGSLPSSCSSVTNGQLYSGDLDDEYLPCSGSWSAVSSWKLVNASGGESGSCTEAGSGEAQYTLDQRVQDHPNEQALGVQITFSFESPGLPLFTMTSSQYTALSLPPSEG